MREELERRDRRGDLMGLKEVVAPQRRVGFLARFVRENEEAVWSGVCLSTISFFFLNIARGEQLSLTLAWATGSCPSFGFLQKGREWLPFCGSHAERAFHLIWEENERKRTLRGSDWKIKKTKIKIKNNEYLINEFEIYFFYGN